MRMRCEDAAIPAGFAWSSPFTRWQGALAECSSIDLAVNVTGRALTERAVDVGEIAQLVLGITVPQHQSFYGAPTVAARIGATGVGGPMVAQACATGVVCVQTAAAAVELSAEGLQLVVATDRTSNGPHVVYPGPSRPGGTPVAEDWVLDNFAGDPWAGEAMVATAEHVAREQGFGREEVDAVTLLRHEQYLAALAGDRAFQRRYMVAAHLPRRRGEPLVVDADEGVHPTTAEGLARLRPVQEDGVITYGTQTHPADGCAGAIVTATARARSLSAGEGVARLLGFGAARVAAARMPTAPVPAAHEALAAAGVDVGELDAVVTHNPFPVNDLYFSRETGFPLERMNVHGSSLVFGHPQAPTGLRGIVELIETLRLRGGGLGLFTGCAAGDTGAAVVVRVDG